MRNSESSHGRRHTDYSAIWAELGDETVQVMALGCQMLGTLWESAWAEGNGSAVPDSRLTARRFTDLRDLYDTIGFVQSLNLTDMVDRADLFPES